MRTGSVVVVSWFALSIYAHLSRAQEPNSNVERCLASAIGAHALPPAFPREGQNGHLFVIELQNIGSKPCMLYQPNIELVPGSNPYNSLSLAADRPAAEVGKEEYTPKLLDPGEWAHVLFAWISRAAPEIPCNLHSGLKLHLIQIDPNMPVPDPAAIEVRNLWIRSCPSVFVSGFRKGRYSPESMTSAAWLNWSSPGGVEGAGFPTQPTSSEVAAGSPVYKLHTPVARTMLGDYLQLRLTFPRDADAGCAFRLVRKREGNGATVISIQQCAELDAGKEPPAPQYFESGVSRLEVLALDLLAERPGPVAYEVMGLVEPSGTRRFASVNLDLIARDPAVPAQAAVLSPLPECRASQLHFASPEPIVSERLETLRAYEATNISDQACSVAGVPAVRFLDEKGNDEPFVPKTCPNCDNHLFNARPNGRIDLKPGESAHFLAGVTAIDTHEDPWMYCQSASQLELTAPADEKPVPLPLDAGVCAAIDLSVWRAGKFDHDPQNTEWEKTHNGVLRDPATAPPADCNKPELAALGRPVMMLSENETNWGLSVASHTFVKGEPVPLHLWIDNRGDQAAAVWTCMELDYFKARGFDLYDAYGHRVLRKREVELREECKKDPRIARMEWGWSCTRNFQIPIPAHTCMAGNNYDFTAQLAQEYDLPPGEYTVHVPEEKAQSTENICSEHQEAPFAITPGKDLTFQVVQP